MEIRLDTKLDFSSYSVFSCVGGDSRVDTYMHDPAHSGTKLGETIESHLTLSMTRLGTGLTKSPTR